MEVQVLSSAPYFFNKTLSAFSIKHCPPKNHATDLRDCYLAGGFPGWFSYGKNKGAAKAP
jgi:hypothetical protein